MVASGAGVTLLPEMALATESKRAGLSVRTFANPAPHRTIGMVWRRGTATEIALKAVAATIRGVWDTVAVAGDPDQTGARPRRPGLVSTPRPAKRH
jgi:LysR family hydrogen peroxide-inducible transcriptional activator